MHPAFTDSGAPSTGSIVLALAVHGDPVVRADRSYVKVLLDLYAKSELGTPFEFDEPELQNAGRVVMLYDRNPDEDHDDIAASDITEQINTLLFGNVKVHAMTQYLSLISSWVAASDVAQA